MQIVDKVEDKLYKEYQEAKTEAEKKAAKKKWIEYADKRDAKLRADGFCV